MSVGKYELDNISDIYIYIYIYINKYSILLTEYHKHWCNITLVRKPNNINVYSEFSSIVNSITDI